VSDLAEAARSSRRKLGRYEIVAEIARGGMGTVYLARLEGVAGFQRLFALKLLHRHLADEPQFVSMLLDEARLAARLHHPNAVGIVDVSDSPLGYYLVMEYVDGFSLDQLLGRLEDPRQRARVGMRIFLDACAGLDAAHRLTDDEGEPLGIVHRDVSPQNILVGTDGAGRITDFGVARAAARITSSRPGMLKGKPCYMAPEQARGGEHLDARADVFALGVVLWEILAGTRLFQSPEGGAAVTLLQVCNAPIDPPSSRHEGLPSSIDEVVMGALERDLDGRTASARALADALERVASQEGWLASRHEVADAVATLFADAIEKRRAAIRSHVGSLGQTPAEPMLSSDIYDVPRLQAQARAAAEPTSEPWYETPRSDPAASAPAPGSADEMPAHELALTATSASHPRVDEAGQGAGGKIASVVESPQRWMRWAAALAATGAALLGLAFAVASRGDEADTRGSAGQRDAVVVSPFGEPGPEEPAAEELEAEALEAEALEAEELEAEELAAEALEAEELEAEAPASEDPDEALEAEAPGRATAATPRRPPRPDRRRSPRPTPPPLETNPYLAR